MEQIIKEVLLKQASNKHELIKKKKNGTDHKRSSVKASIKQTRIKKLEKYPKTKITL